MAVAAVAAYASYVHQREFALQGGADATSATLWPLSVDGLLLLATVGLLTPARHASRRTRFVIWLAFLLGIAVSLAANIAAAPTLAWKPVLVAGWPPVALLLSEELLAHRPTGREPAETAPAVEPVRLGRAARRDETGEGERDEPGKAEREEVGQSESRAGHAGLPDGERPPGAPTAEQVMWEYFERLRARGRTPTGAELDRVAGTNNYGRAVLARWRRAGRIPAAADRMRANGTPGQL
ncbi:DUF2637 domain-containing protein [Streptomyces incanus]